MHSYICIMPNSLKSITSLSCFVFDYVTPAVPAYTKIVMTAVHIASFNFEKLIFTHSITCYHNNDQCVTNVMSIFFIFIKTKHS